MPLTSIAIPFSGESVADFELAVRSVFAQTTHEWELLLVADSALPELLGRARAVTDPRVVVVDDGEKHNLSHRLNLASKLANGTELVRMDADDAMHPDRVRILGEYLRLGGIDVIGSRAMLMDEQDRVRGLFREPNIPATPAGFLKNNVFSHPTVAAKVDWFRAHPYDEGFMRAQDKELWLRTFAISNFYKLDDALLFYRVRSSVSLAKAALSARWSRRAIRRHGPRLVGIPRTAASLITARARTGAQAMLHTVGWESQIYERKYERLADSAIGASQRILDTIRLQQVPGWDR